MDERVARTEEERQYYSLNKRVYATFAPFYDVVTFPLSRLRRQVALLAGLDVCSHVLDVATGTGAQARAFAEKAGAVVGIDLSAAMLGVARRKNQFPNLTFRRADATELPFADATFDVSCISFGLHEMPRSIRERTVAEMARVTKPAGTLLIVDYAPPRGTFGTGVSRLVRLYERDYYGDFIRSDLRALLRQMGIEARDERRVLLGAVRIMIGSRLDAGADRSTASARESRGSRHSDP